MLPREMYWKSLFRLSFFSLASAHDVMATAYEYVMLGRRISRKVTAFLILSAKLCTKAQEKEAGM